MHGWLSGAGRLSGDPVSTPRASQLTMASAVVLVLAQLAFRAWAVFPSWFYLDDYHLLRDAQTSHSVGDLLAPYNGHLMPGGRLLVLWVESSGQLNWTLAATLTLCLQLVASVSALWMLVTLFGARPAIIGPLALYLFSPMTLPAFMWWTACLSQITMQAGFFLAVAA